MQNLITIGKQICRSQSIIDAELTTYSQIKQYYSMVVGYSERIRGPTPILHIDPQGWNIFFHYGWSSQGKLTIAFVIEALSLFLVLAQAEYNTLRVLVWREHPSNPFFGWYIHLVGVDHARPLQKWNRKAFPTTMDGIIKPNTSFTLAHNTTNSQGF